MGIIAEGVGFPQTGSAEIVLVATSKITTRHFLTECVSSAEAGDLLLYDMLACIPQALWLQVEGGAEHTFAVNVVWDSAFQGGEGVSSLPEELKSVQKLLRPCV
jgi:hypothetical protein